MKALPFAKPTKRVRDAEYMAFVRTLPCAARLLGRSACMGLVEADHMLRNHGGNRRGDDTACAPLCHLHHSQRHAWSGPFADWTREQMRDWCARVIAETHAQWEKLHHDR